MKRAYMDHAADTPVRPEVLAAMLPFLTERVGNPSAVYDLGSEIKAVMVSIGNGSNEIGTVQDISALVAVCRAAGAAFHTDAVATLAQGSLVFTLNRTNREEEVHHVLAHLPPAIENLRSFPPVWRQKMAEAAGGPR
jgi:cysteine sulfinate desulfinase/cysteine desulfurase-like protein